MGAAKTVKIPGRTDKGIPWYQASGRREAEAAHGQRQSAQDHQHAGQVIAHEVFGQEQDRLQRRHQRHQVEEHAGAVAAQLLHRLVVEGKADKRADDAGVADDACAARPAPGRRGARGQWPRSAAA